MSNSTHTNDSGLRLAPRDEKFSYPEKLKRSEIDEFDASLWEELSIAASENELTDHNLLENEEFKQEVSRYSRLRLKADEQHRYPNKDSLKKGSSKTFLWVGSAAATIALLIAIPAIMRNTPSDLSVPQVAAIPQSPIENSKPVENTPAIAQFEQPAVQTKKNTGTAANPSETGKEEVQPQSIQQVEKRESLGLQTMTTPQPITLVANTKESIKHQQAETADQNTVILASAEEFEHIEVERPNLLDRLKEKSIVSFNRIRGEGTMVIKEYDKNGRLTLYAVQSNTLNFEKNYTE